jgi:asparagine synthetase B (glutamine-hydrolysing)
VRSDLQTRLTPAFWRTIMRFTTPDLAAAVGIETVSPFAEPALVDLALALPYEAFIGRRDGRVMGKWIIRQAVEALLPDDLVWRVKTPIEYGSGSTFLGPLLAARISDGAFANAQADYERHDGVRLREKEQLHYYRIFREIFGPVSAASAASGDCPYCGTLIDPPRRNYCGVCGAGDSTRPDARRPGAVMTQTAGHHPAVAAPGPRAARR